MRFLHTSSKISSAADVDSNLQALAPYVSDLSTIYQNDRYDALEASVLLSKSEKTLESIEQYFNDKKDTIKLVILIGIGGSNLGAVAIHEALQNKKTRQKVDLVTLDTVSLESVEQIQKQYSQDFLQNHSLVVMISKSGQTTETIVNGELLVSAYRSKEIFFKNLVVVTDEGSELYDFANNSAIATFTIPKLVGGRFSVLSAVGLVPLYVLGYDCRELLRGAREILPYCIQNDDLYHNPAAVSAAHQLFFLEQGYVVHDFFTFLPELESVGKWYRQLLGESIGKYSEEKKQFVGILPTVSVGSTDLHSVGQYYLGGQKIAMTTFVYAEGMEDKTISKLERVFAPLVDMVDNKSVQHVVTAILTGTKDAYNECEIPFFEVVLNGVSEYELGALMQFKMIEIMYLGRLCQIDAFDQPNVELYKKFTRDNLDKK